MENHTKRPDPREAAAALDLAAQAPRALAPYVGSPPWLYPLQGVAVATLMLGLAFLQDSWFGPAGLALGVALLTVLSMTRSHGRVSADVYTQPGSRGPAWIYAAVVALLLAGALVVRPLGAPTWIVFVLAGVALVLTVVVGPRLDRRAAAALAAAS